MNNYEELCDDKGVDPIDFLAELDENMQYELVEALLEENGDILGVRVSIQRMFEVWINDKPPMIYSKEDMGDQNYEIAKDNKLNPIGANDGC